MLYEWLLCLKSPVRATKFQQPCQISWCFYSIWKLCQGEEPNLKEHKNPWSYKVHSCSEYLELWTWQEGTRVIDHRGVIDTWSFLSVQISSGHRCGHDESVMGHALLCFSNWMAYTKSNIYSKSISPSMGNFKWGIVVLCHPALLTYSVLEPHLQGGGRAHLFQQLDAAAGNDVPLKRWYLCWLWSKQHQPSSAGRRKDGEKVK